MLSQLPTILQCLYCGREGLKLGATTKTYRLKTEWEELELVETGRVVCPRCNMSYFIKDGILNMLPHTLKGLNLAQLSGQWKLTAVAYERIWRMKALTWLGQREWLPSAEIETLIRMIGTETLPQKLTTHNGFAFYLDLACANAFYGRNIAKTLAGHKINTGTATGVVVSLDNSWAMLQEARNYIKQAGLTGYVSLIRADAEFLPFIDHSLAGVAGGGILNEFQNPEKALIEAARVLASNASFVCMNQIAATRNPAQAIQKLFGLSSGLQFFEKAELSQLFEKAGFKLKEQVANGVITINHLMAA
jgi:SAM-dependent methyltransferase/uncharacterized protein YbaR (Trm112 family)